MNVILAHPSNYTAGRRADPNALVVHYTGNDGDTAEGNATYFTRPNKDQVSANFFVDEYGWYLSVRESDTAHHCSTTNPDINNYNSLGIEMCSRIDENGNYYIHPDTITNAIALLISLMAKYNIGIDRVVRHFDITGKRCPAPFVDDESQWWEFKARLEEDEMAKIIEQIAGVAGLSVPDTIEALGVLARFANTTNEDWEQKGVQSLLDSGLITTPRDGRELVEFGEFGVILNRFKDKFAK